MQDGRELEVRTFRREYGVRYYRWAVNVAQRELDSDFSLVRRVKNAAAVKYLQYAAKLDASARRDFVFALAKRFHKNILGDLGEPISPAQQRIIDYYLGVRFTLSSEIPKVNRRRLARLAKEVLTPLAGQVIPSTGASWWHDLSLPGCLLRTSIDVGMKFEHLAYFHSLQTSDNMSICPNISLLQWLGISGGTEWMLESDEQAEETVNTLKELCELFIKAAPSLVAIPGLSSIAQNGSSQP